MDEQTGVAGSWSEHADRAGDSADATELRNETCIQDQPSRDLIDPDWLVEYGRQRNVLFRQLKGLDERLFLLEKIVWFPWGVFVLVSPFWGITRDALFDACVVQIARLGGDTGRDLLTLARFKNLAAEHLIEGKWKRELKSLLAGVGFSDTLRTVKRDVMPLRNYHLAHLHRVRNTDKYADPVYIDDLTRVSTPLLVKIAGSLNAAFELLCFGDGLRVQERRYCRDYRVDKQGDDLDNPPDIDRLLDRIAFESEKLHLPERSPEEWRLQRQIGLTHAELESFNAYRRKFGLPEA